MFLAFFLFEYVLSARRFIVRQESSRELVYVDKTRVNEKIGSSIHGESHYMVGAVSG